MKILILYASRAGTTERAASILSEKLKSASTFQTEYCRITDVDEEKVQAADVIVVGSSVRFARLQKECRTFLTKSDEETKNKIKGAFLVMGYPIRYEEYSRLFTKRIPGLIIEPGNFGGELKPKNHNGFDRFIVKSIRRKIREADFDNGFNETVLPELIPENIELFAYTLKKLLAENS